MNTKLTFLILSFSLFLILIIIYFTSRKKIIVKYSLVWFISTFILVIFSIFPKLLKMVTSILGFELASNMVYAIFIGLLLFICLSLTIIVSGQKEKIKLLIQETSILKEKIEKIESKK